VETDASGLVRFWFEFDLRGHEPEREPGRVQVDGGTAAYRLLGRGAGVTGYDESDCLRLLHDALGDELPPLLRVERNPTIDDRLAREIGNVTWRGIWLPRLNMGGPTAI